MFPSGSGGAHSGKAGNGGAGGKFRQVECGNWNITTILFKGKGGVGGNGGRGGDGGDSAGLFLPFEYNLVEDSLDYNNKV